MMDRLIISTHLQDHLKRGERLPLTLRLEIKRTVEEARNEWRKWDRLDADPGMRNIESDAQRAVLGWIRILRLHVMDWTGRARCRRRRFGTCNTCTLLFYLCRVFMNPSKPSQYAAFERRLLSSAATVLIWVIILASVSGLLSNTRALNDLADTAVVGIFVAVTFAVYASLGMFVKETVELLPYDSPPFLPLWFDNMNRSGYAAAGHCCPWPILCWICAARRQHNWFAIDEEMLQSSRVRDLRSRQRGHVLRRWDRFGRIAGCARHRRPRDPQDR